MFTSAKNIYRVLQIARTLARHDALFPIEEAGVAKGMIATVRLLSWKRGDGRPGQRLAGALQELGPSFVKLGQALSTRQDLFGEEIAADLSKLQDHVPAFSFSEAKQTIETELGETLDNLFNTFEPEPLAAASIAQVHLAVTREGAEVAVKVLRPGIETAFETDFTLFHWLADLVQRNRPDLRRLRPVEVIDTFRETTKLEMDLRLEAAAAEEIEKNFEGDPDFRVPGVDWRRTSRRVMTMERINGVPIDEREDLIKRGLEPDLILAKAATALFKQVFRDGFFHADQHPGNLFVGEDGEIIAVDFGIMGRLDRPTRRYLGEMLMSFLNRDYRRVAEVHFEAGYVPAHKSIQAFTQACRSIAEPILDRPQNEISIARLLAHLFQVTETFEMETQPQLLLLQKTMLVAEGVGRKVSPDANLWFLTQPLIKEWVGDNMGPETLIMEAVEDVTEGLRKIPRMVQDIEKNAAVLARNGVKLHPDTVRSMGYNTSATNPNMSARFYLILMAILLLLLLFV